MRTLSVLGSSLSAACTVRISVPVERDGPWRTAQRTLALAQKRSATSGCQLFDHGVVLRLWERRPVVVGVPHHHSQLHGLGDRSPIGTLNHDTDQELTKQKDQKGWNGHLHAAVVQWALGRLHLWTPLVFTWESVNQWWNLLTKPRYVQSDWWCVIIWWMAR